MPKVHAVASERTLLVDEDKLSNLHAAEAALSDKAYPLPQAGHTEKCKLSWVATWQQVQNFSGFTLAKKKK